MKKIFLLFLATTGLLISCDNDSLEPFTPGALTDENAITSSADLERLMNSAYNLLTNRQDVVFTSLFTDECGIGFANGGQGIAGDYIFFLNANSGSPEVIWETAYYALSRANRVIAFADNVQPIGATAADLANDQEKINRSKAEALVIRAICHIRIMSYFSTDPKSDGALAGVLADRIILPGETLARSTNADFYALIHSDLNAAMTIFDTNNVTPAYANPTFYASKNLAKAMKARAYALKGDYTNAEIWANDVINTSGIQLANTTEYTKVFWTENEATNTEVIFRLKRTAAQNSQATNLHNGWCSVRPNASGSPLFEVSRSLHNILNPGNLLGNQISTISDVRARTIIAPSSVIDPSYATSTDFRNSDKLIINKHGGTGVGTTTWASTATNGNNNDHKIARISEMYLIKAEARVAAGDLAGAASVLETLIDARNTVNQPTPVFANATQAWAEILKQRRLEFAFEGYRYIDLKRLGALAGASIDRDPADYSSSSSNYPEGNPVNLPLSSYKFTLPIPLVETTANPSAQQNPGY
jgi:starch-binding outer membrane protein, SusD/RagB family